MKTKSLPLPKITLSAIFFIGASLSWVACTKDKETDALAPSASSEKPAMDLGEAKAPTNMFTMSNSNGNCKFSCWHGCDGCYGQAFSGSCSQIYYNNNNGVVDLRIQGTSSSGVPNTCYLVKGPNASTGGDIYYFVPNQGATPRKILKLQVKGVAIPIHSGEWFNYNVATNTWTVSGNPTTYFIWSIVNSLPANCC